MKKRDGFTIFLVGMLFLTITIGWFTPKDARASKAEDFSYTIDTEGVVITGYQGGDKDVAVPPVIEGKPVTAIESYTFLRTDITSIILPEGIRYIGNSAFQECSSLEHISIPDSVDYIGIYAFKGCLKLRAIRIPEGVTKIYNETFYRCLALEEVILPASLDEIRYKGFQSCFQLRMVRFLGDAPQLGEGVFNKLKDLTIQYPYGAAGFTNPWAENKTQPFYRVVYHGNRETEGLPPVDENIYLEENEGRIMDNGGGLQREGYTFAGWNTDPEGDGIPYTPGAIFTMGRDHLHLYAQWIKNPSHITAPRVQLKIGTALDSPTTTLRFIAGLNSLKDVDEMGFVLSFGKGDGIRYSTKRVYKAIYAEEELIEADYFGSNYILALTSRDIPREDFSKRIFVQPYVKLVDGRTSYGQGRTFCIATIVSLSHKKADAHINVNVELGDEEGQIPIGRIARKAENLNPRKK